MGKLRQPISLPPVVDYSLLEGIEIGVPYRTDSDHERKTEGERFEEYSPEHVTFDYIFRRPWTSGEYDT